MPSYVAERLIQTGPLGKRNVDQLGVYPGTDTFDFWWSKRVTNYSQENLVWAAMLMFNWAAAIYPTKNDSYLRRWAVYCGRNRRTWLAVRLLGASVPIAIGYAAIWPDDEFSKRWRSLTTMPAGFVIKGVN